MKFVNSRGLPDALVRAVTNDPYSKGDADASVTELVDSPRVRELIRRHDDEIVEDVADRFWPLLGQSVHVILERANKTAIAERRLTIEEGGWKISGAMDLYDEEGVITDYKVTSVWAVKGGQIRDEWINQLNIYGEILRRHKHPVKGLRIVAMLRDWSRSAADREADYPQSPIAVFDFLPWTSERTNQYIQERVTLHKQARAGALPECTQEERWPDERPFAVMKKGRKSAVRIFATRPEAVAYLATLSDEHSLVVRPASRRCVGFCSVSKFCSQFKALSASVDATEPTAMSGVS